MRSQKRKHFRKFCFEATPENTAFLRSEKKAGYSYFVTINAAIYGYRKIYPLKQRLEVLKRSLAEHDAKAKQTKKQK